MPAKKPNLFGRRATRPRNATPASGASFFRLTGSYGDRKPTTASGGGSSSYKGFRIYRKGDGWTTSLDKDSIFDTKAEAQRFLRSWNKKNPPKKANDAIDDGVKAGLSAYETVTDIPGLLRGGLGIKDRIKHALLGTKRKRNDGDSDDLIQHAATARSAQELQRLRKYALNQKDKELEAAVMKRAKELGFKVADLTGADESWWNPKGKGKRKNPESGAERMYEKFHGAAAEQTITVEEEVHEHEHLAALGILVNMKVATLSRLDVTIGMSADDSAKANFDETVADPDVIYLCSNEDGTQLYFVGGDQSLDLATLKMGKFEKDDMIIGVLTEITYRTRKEFDTWSLIDYYHSLGEETGDQPMLRYDPRSPHLYVTGGKYKIKVPLIGVSPGIEN